MNGTIISFPHSAAMAMSAPPVPSPPVGSNFTFQISPASSKKGSNTAEKRANHNAVERARRECLNTKFQELAHALPSLSQVRRPSKSVIVQKSLDFIYGNRQKDEQHEKEVRSLRNENDSLREELNNLRKTLNLPPLPPREEVVPETTPSRKSTMDKERDTDTESIASPMGYKSPCSDNNDSLMKHEDNKSDDGDSAGTDDDFDTDPTDALDGIHGNDLYTLLTPTGPPTHMTEEYDFGLGFHHNRDHSLYNYSGVQTLCQPFPVTNVLFQAPPYGQYMDMNAAVAYELQ